FKRIPQRRQPPANQGILIPQLFLLFKIHAVFPFSSSWMLSTARGMRATTWGGRCMSPTDTRHACPTVRFHVTHDFVLGLGVERRLSPLPRFVLCIPGCHTETLSRKLCISSSFCAHLVPMGRTYCGICLYVYASSINDTV